MNIEPMYYGVFYDTDKPKTTYFAMHKRISEKTYFNLTDGMEGKNVELRNVDDKIAKYKINSISTFSIFNSVDNHYFAVCDCEKIKEPQNIFK